MANMEAVTVARIFVNEFVSRYGTPEFLHTDQGKNFESNLMKEVCQILRIVKTCTTPFHPQSDGLIERFNCTLLQMLSTVVIDHHEDCMGPPTSSGYVGLQKQCSRNNQSHAF